MYTTKAATDHLNHGQNPVITLDQSLNAIARAIQWDPTTRFNEDNYFVLLGPLHKEMLFEKLLEDWLRNSDWVEMHVDTDVTSPGRALLKGSHVTRTRYAHQVAALSLSILRKMPIHDTRLFVRRMRLNSYRSKHGAYSKAARCLN